MLAAVNFCRSRFYARSSRFGFPVQGSEFGVHGSGSGCSRLRDSAIGDSEFRARGSAAHGRAGQLERTWFTATPDGIFRSTDLSNWVECLSGFPGGADVSGPLVTGDGDLHVMSGVIYRSTDRCRSWWPLSDVGWAGRVFNAPDDSVPVLGSGVRRFDLAQRTWQEWPSESEMEVTSAVAESKGRYWVGRAQGVCLLVVQGQEWNVWRMRLDGEHIVWIGSDPSGYLLAAVEGRGLFRAALR